MNPAALKATLRQPYQQQAWLQTLREVLPTTQQFASPQPLSIQEKGVVAITQLGNVPLHGGRTLAVVEVRLDASKNLLKNRIGLRNVVAKCIDQAQHHGVLAVFIGEQAGDYRLTLAAKESTFNEQGQLTHNETAPRRYSFVLGQGEACTTAANRLAALAGKGQAATLQDVVDAFSVEKLNKEFFSRYKEHYQRFVAHLLAGDAPQAVFELPQHFADDKARDQAQKPIRDFAKKLLGRLVFLHFLQKKGWLGCPAGASTWADGDAQFLRTLFNQAPDKAQFYSTRLVPLFFEALNRNGRAGDLFAPTGTRIPYLNGGLFEDDRPAAQQLDFPPALFDELLQFFGEYNFTIDENDPEDHEVGIDPEMLGHVFENLLEDNKDKGAYYTPKAIVQYMCQQSLLHYLQTHLGEHAELATLVRSKDRGDEKDKQNWVLKNAKEIERLLDAVKICDPAIGSGAFPIGLLQEIYWIKLTLDWTLDRAAAKRRIIQHSIYGVDVDAGAVEIARLRFWLALIVDEDQPSPLPNLDYKIMQGDSLLESFEGIRLDQLFEQHYQVNVIGGQGQLDLNSPGTQLTLVSEERRNTLTALTTGYFAETNPEKKQALHRQIDQMVLQHIDHNIALQRERIETELAQHQAVIKAKQKQAKGWKPTEKTSKRMAVLEAELKHCTQRLKKLMQLESTAERPYFLWHLYFQEVFEQGGFDVVIANPPYVSSEKFSKTGIQEIWKQRYKTYASRVDIYCLFYELGNCLLKHGGVLCYISSNKFLRADYGKNLRTYLQAEGSIETILDFGELPVFAAATDPAILLYRRAPASEAHEFTTATIKAEEELYQLDAAVAKRQEQLPQAALKVEGWSLDSGTSQQLLTKLREIGQPLAMHVADRFYYGIKTGFNAAFVIDASIRERLIVEDSRSAELIKPWLQGHEIKRWHNKWAGLYLISVRYGFHEQLKGYPAILRHLKKHEVALKKRGQCTTSRGGSNEGQHHWLELDNNPSERYLSEFERPKIVFNETSKRLHAFVDEQQFYVNKTGFIIVAEHPYFLLAVLNSKLLDYLYRTEFPSWGDPWKGGRVQFRGSRMKDVPIPPATDEQIKELERLSHAASKAAGGALLDIESQIDQVVYELFKLTTNEIAYVEQRFPIIAPAMDAKTTLFKRVLPTLCECSPYFSQVQIVIELEALELDLPEDTLRHYLSEAMSTGVVHDAGRGWYSRLAEAFVLDAKPVRPLVQAVKKQFPLLAFSCWSTAQINAYTQHLLSRHTALLYAEADALPSVAEHLRERGWQVLLNPKATEVAQQLRPSDKTVVLRPALSKQPEAQDHFAPIEKLLVDLLVEADALQLMDVSEAQRVLQNAVESARVPVAALLAYAKRRAVSVPLLEQSIKSTNKENVELMD